MADGTIYPEGQPLPIDPLFGISPTAQAASAATPQDPVTLAQNAIKAITNPNLPGGGMVFGSTPTTPKMPLPPVTMSPQGAIPQGPFGSVGERKRADRQAALNSISNLVQTAQKRVYEKKVQDLKFDFERLNNARTGYIQAIQSGNQAEAEHNKQIMHDVLYGKNGKELAKAFDINLNPMAQEKKKQKPNPALEALNQMGQPAPAGAPQGGATGSPQSSIQPNAQVGGAPQGTPQGPSPMQTPAQGGGLPPGQVPGQPIGGGIQDPRVQAFLGSQPTTLQMNPALQMQAELVKNKLLPSADVVAQTIGRISDAAITGMTRMSVAQAQITSAQIMRAAFMSGQRLAVLGKLSSEDLRHFYKMQEILKQHELNMKELNPLKQAEGLEKTAKTVEDTMGTVKYHPDGSIAEATGLRGRIAEDQQELKDLHNSMGMTGTGSGLFRKPVNSIKDIDEILNSHHPLMYYGYTDDNLSTLRDMKGLMENIAVMQSAVKALGVEKEAIGKQSADLARRGIYAPSNGTTGPANINSPGTTEGDDGDGETEPKLDTGADLFERSFGNILRPIEQETPRTEGNPPNE